MSNKDLQANSITYCSIQDVKQFLKLCYLTKRNLNLIGNPGIGKTVSVIDYLKEMGEGKTGTDAPKLVTKVLSMCDRLDFIGQVIDHERNVMKEVVAEWILDLTEEANPEGPMTVLYFNEANCASESLKPVFFRLLEERQIGNYTLRDNVQIVQDGNPPSRGVSSNELLWPEKRRVLTVHVVADREEWLEWAVSNGVHHEVIGFLSQPSHAEFFENFDPTKRECYAWANPASWVKFSTDLPHLEGMGNRVFLADAEGNVGREAAARFVAWQEIGRDAPDYRKFIENPDSVDFANLKPDMQWFMMSQVANHALQGKSPKPGELPETMDKCLDVSGWLSDQGIAEMSLFLTRYIVARADKKLRMKIAKHSATQKFVKNMKDSPFLKEVLDLAVAA
jgi:hypothetical protein